MLHFLVVNYHSSSCLKRLLSGQEFQHNQWPVMVVNNSPADSELYELKKYYSPLLIVEAMKNVGFGQGCNIGLRQIYHQSFRARVWLLNPDTELLIDAVKAVSTHLDRHPELAILGTKILDANGTPWFEVGAFNSWLGTVPHLDSVTQEENAELRTSRWISGCSLILNLAQFDHCPQFDPQFFLYYEDTDLCERYYRKNYGIAVTCQAWVIHHVSSLANQNMRFKWTHATFSKLYFLEKHGTWLAVGLNITYIVAKVIWDGIKGDIESALGRWYGLSAYILRQPPHAKTNLSS